MFPYFQGVIVGISFAVLLGPSFFALIQTCIQRGLKPGLLFAAGIFFSDIAALLLCYFGASQILGEDPRENMLFSMAGGIVLTLLGVYTFSKKDIHKQNSETDSNQRSQKKWYLYLIKGFVLNALNPGVWFIWITIVISIGARYGVNSRAIFLFLSGILSTTLAADALKCFISSYIKRQLSLHIMIWLNRVVGIILIVFGIVMIANVIIDFEYVPFLHSGQKGFSSWISSLTNWGLLLSRSVS